MEAVSLWNTKTFKVFHTSCLPCFIHWYLVTLLLQSCFRKAEIPHRSFKKVYSVWLWVAKWTHTFYSYHTLSLSVTHISVSWVHVRRLLTTFTCSPMYDNDGSAALTSALVDGPLAQNLHIKLLLASSFELDLHCDICKSNNSSAPELCITLLMIRFVFAFLLMMCYWTPLSFYPQFCFWQWDVQYKKPLCKSASVCVGHVLTSNGSSWANKKPIIPWRGYSINMLVGTQLLRNELGHVHF